MGNLASGRMELLASGGNGVDCQGIVGSELCDVIQRLAAGFQLGCGPVNNDRARAVGALEPAQQDRTVKLVPAAGQHRSRSFADEGICHVQHRVDGDGHAPELWMFGQADDARFEVALRCKMAHVGDLLHRAIIDFARRFDSHGSGRYGKGGGLFF